MEVAMDNFFTDLPETLPEELVTGMITGGHFRVERIVSQGHVAPPSGWFDQQDHEWVIILEGEAILQFSDGPERHLSRGDYLNIPAHTRHRVTWTDPTRHTVWLAIHYR
jgi:cupin 2 domain-containing protein